jgi:flagellin-like protein
MIMHLGKKGVSPLIATVLLLAFAVALATVIIQLDPFTGCTINAHIQGDASSKRICFDEKTNEIVAFIVNEDENRNIVGFKVSISGEKDVKNEDIMEPILTRETKKISPSYDLATFGRIIDFQITPMINVSNNIKLCNMKEKITSIPPCAQ